MSWLEDRGGQTAMLGMRTGSMSHCPTERCGPDVEGGRERERERETERERESLSVLKDDMLSFSELCVTINYTFD